MAFCSNKGVFNEFLEDIGSLRNAFTSMQTICFYEVIPSEYIETVMEHESKRMESIDVDADKFLTEKGAIIEERSMVYDTNPSGQYFEATMANVFNRKSGGISIIGWNHEIKSITPKDLVDFHDKWFAPNNATVIIIGDIDVKKIKSLVEKYFGNIKEKRLPARNEKMERPPCFKEINFGSPKNGSMASADYVYFVPFSPKSDFRKCVSLDLAVKIMNQADFFAKKTLEHSLNKASSVHFEYVVGYSCCSFATISISCSSLNNLVDSEKLWEYLGRKIRNINVSKQDLESVKRQEQIAMAYKKDDVEKMSKYIGWLLSSGYTTDQIQSMDDTMQSITIDECRAVIREVFCADPIAVSRITPKGYDRD
jgi:zinc protease